MSAPRMLLIFVCWLALVMWIIDSAGCSSVTPC